MVRVGVGKAQRGVDRARRQVVGVDLQVGSPCPEVARAPQQMQAQGAMSRQGWNRRKGATSIDLMKKIEGELTKEKTLEILKENQDSLARAYLIQWVEEADDAQLQKLIFAITGSNSLNEDLVIDLKELPANGSLPLPIYHTCFNTIELYNYPTFEIFKSKLEDSLANVTGSGLTIA